MNENDSGYLLTPDHEYSGLRAVGATETVKDTNSSNGTEKVCPICKKVLPPKANLSFHLMLHPKTEKPYACDKCLFVTMFREELSEHCKEAHRSNRKYSCAICKKEFTNVRSLNKHKPIHALVLPFSCAYCDKGFPEYGYWRQHEVAHKTGRYECEDCQVKFTTVKFYNDHRDKGSCKTAVLTCCTQVFSTRMDYVKHCFEHHRFQKKDEHGCEFCGRLYAFRCLLNIHLTHCKLRKDKSKPNFNPKPNEHPEGDRPENKLSPQEAENPNASIITVEKRTATGTRKVYRCNFCSRTYLTRSWLIEHRRRHLDPNYKKYVCSLCNKKYSSYSAFYYHKQRLHLKIRRFKCPHCEKAFFDGQSLKDHITSHTGEKPYSCDYCPRKFRNRSTKIEHHRVHTGERPYQCRYCDLRFKRNDAKISHERRHTGEKPFKCRICDRCFTQDSTWRSHEKKHQPPYSCTLCELLFMSKDMLINHKENHDDTTATTKQVQFNTQDWRQPVQMTTDSDGNVYIQYDPP